MACKPWEERLEAYAMGMLNDQEQARVQQHIQTCQQCRRKLAAHQKAARLLTQAFDQNPPDYLRSKIMANLQDVKKSKTHWAYWAAPGLVSIAVLLLIVKIQPGQTMKKQAMETARMEQDNAGPVPSAPKPMLQEKKALAGSIKTSAVAKRKKVSTGMVLKALTPPLEEEPDSQEAGVAETKSWAGNASVFKPEAKKDERPLPTKYTSADILSEPVGGGMPAAAAPEPEPEKQQEFGTLAKSDSTLPKLALPPRMLRGAGFERRCIRIEEPDQSESVPYKAGEKKTLTSALSLVEIKGALNTTQVNNELNKLAPLLADLISQDGDARTVQLSLAVDQQGRIITVAFISAAFNSNQLNLFIMDKIKKAHFDPPLNSLPATIIIAIEVK